MTRIYPVVWLVGRKRPDLVSSYQEVIRCILPKVDAVRRNPRRFHDGTNAGGILPHLVIITNYKLSSALTAEDIITARPEFQYLVMVDATTRKLMENFAEKNKNVHLANKNEGIQQFILDFLKNV